MDGHPFERLLLHLHAAGARKLSLAGNPRHFCQRGVRRAEVDTDSSDGLVGDAQGNTGRRKRARKSFAMGRLSAGSVPA